MSIHVVGSTPIGLATPVAPFIDNALVRLPNSELLSVIPVTAAQIPTIATGPWCVTRFQDHCATLYYHGARRSPLPNPLTVVVVQGRDEGVGLGAVIFLRPLLHWEQTLENKEKDRGFQYLHDGQVGLAMRFFIEAWDAEVQCAVGGPAGPRQSALQMVERFWRPIWNAMLPLMPDMDATDWPRLSGRSPLRGISRRSSPALVYAAAQYAVGQILEKMRGHLDVKPNDLVEVAHHAARAYRKGMELAEEKRAHAGYAEERIWDRLRTESIRGLAEYGVWRARFLMDKDLPGCVEDALRAALGWYERLGDPRSEVSTALLLVRYYLRSEQLLRAREVLDKVAPVVAQIDESFLQRQFESLQRQVDDPHTVANDAQRFEQEGDGMCEAFPCLPEHVAIFTANTYMTALRGYDSAYDVKSVARIWFKTGEVGRQVQSDNKEWVLGALFAYLLAEQFAQRAEDHVLLDRIRDTLADGPWEPTQVEVARTNVALFFATTDLAERKRILQLMIPAITAEALIWTRGALTVTVLPGGKEE